MKRTTAIALTDAGLLLIRRNLVLATKKIRVYHGSNIPIRRFSPKFSAQGVLWFSEDKDKILRGESGAVSSKYIMTVDLTVNKTAGWAEYGPLLLAQIQQQGYDSIKLDENWVIFDPESQGREN